MPSNDEVDQAFWDRADALIALANEQCDHEGSGKVSASFLFAASRFNAYIVASESVSASELQARREDALNYYTRQFRLMLEDNLDDYIKNFGEYVSAQPSS